MIYNLKKNKVLHNFGTGISVIIVEGYFPRLGEPYYYKNYTKMIFDYKNYIDHQNVKEVLRSQIFIFVLQMPKKFKRKKLYILMP